MNGTVFFCFYLYFGSFPNFCFFFDLFLFVKISVQSGFLCLYLYLSCVNTEACT